MQFDIKNYVFKIWSTSVLTSPIILIVAYVVFFTVGPHDIPVFILMLPIGAMCSLPSLVTLYIALKYTSRSVNSVIQLKLIATAMGFILSYLPFFVINGYHFSMNKITAAICAVYTLSIIAAIWYFKATRSDHIFAETVLMEK